MSRKEAVLLVSRALAIFQFVYALLEITYLPERLISLFGHASAAGASGMDDYFGSYNRVGVVFLLVRIGIQLVLTVVFWNCGPWIERVLLPASGKPDHSTPPASEPASATAKAKATAASLRSARHP
jgi:hypothetical protein